MQVAKALFDGQLLDVHFTRSFYKHMLGVKVTYHDIEAVDPDYYKNLKWMLEVSGYNFGVYNLVFFFFFFILFLLGFSTIICKCSTLKKILVTFSIFFLSFRMM